MLRHHAALKLKKELQTRPVVVAFEEPELFLHPSAANLLRDMCVPLVKGYLAKNEDEVIKGIRSGGWTFIITSDGKFDARSMEPVSSNTGSTKL